MSKGLRALFQIRYNDYDNQKRHKELCDIIEKELKDKEKFEEIVNMDLDLFMKALEIIKQLFDFKYFIEEWYKRGVLPREEYDLLKEVLNNGR